MPAPFSSPFVTIGGRRTCPCSSMVCCRHPTLRQFFPLLSPAPTFPSSLFVPPAGDFLPIAAERFTVVSAGFQPRCGMETGTLPRNRLAASATGGTAAVSQRTPLETLGFKTSSFAGQELHPKSRRSRELAYFYYRYRYPTS